MTDDELIPLDKLMGNFFRSLANPEYALIRWATRLNRVYIVD